MHYIQIGWAYMYDSHQGLSHVVELPKEAYFQ